MIVTVSGGRDFTDRDFIETCLDGFHARNDITFLVEGGATGVDQLARAWAIARYVKFKTEEARWKLLGNAAGAARNARMLINWKPDMVVLFPGGKGTRDMKAQARDRGYQIIDFAPFYPNYKVRMQLKAQAGTL